MAAMYPDSTYAALLERSTTLLDESRVILKRAHAVSLRLNALLRTNISHVVLVKSDAASLANDCLPAPRLRSAGP